MRHVLICGLVVAILGSVGCHSCCKHGRPGCCPPGVNGGLSPAPLVPPPPQPVLVPPASSAGIGGITPPPPPPPAAVPFGSRYPPTTITPGTWEPADTPRVITPPPAVQAGPKVQLLPPVSPPRASTELPKATPPMPVAIPQFSYAKDQAASGSRPFRDGFQWLKSNSFRTVLHVRQPGEDDSADRQLVEDLGMKFQSIELSPRTLTGKQVEDFNQLVGSRDAQPVFVYDRDGLLAGALWYLHFRTVDRLADDQARIRAARLGLKDQGTDDQKEMWGAIQNFLSKQL